MLIRYIVLSFIFSSLISCSYIPRTAQIQDRDKDYLSARTIPPIRVPPGTSSQAIHNYYPVSSNEYPESDKKVNLLPPGL